MLRSGEINTRAEAGRMGRPVWIFWFYHGKSCVQENPAAAFPSGIRLFIWAAGSLRVRTCPACQLGKGTLLSADQRGKVFLLPRGGSPRPGHAAGRFSWDALVRGHKHARWSCFAGITDRGPGAEHVARFTGPVLKIFSLLMFKIQESLQKNTEFGLFFEALVIFPVLLPRQQQPHPSCVHSVLLLIWVTARPLETLKHAVPVPIGPSFDHKVTPSSRFEPGSLLALGPKARVSFRVGQVSPQAVGSQQGQAWGSLLCTSVCLRSPIFYIARVTAA